MLPTAFASFAGLNRNGRRKKSGFSLVEVALALGVLSTSMLGMLSLTVVGLNSLRDAMSQQVHTEIVQQVTTELQMTGFNKLDSYVTGKTLYFSSEATRQDERDSGTRFVVTMDRQQPVFPNSAVTGNMNQSLTTVRIFVTHTVGQTVPPEAKSSCYVVFVPNSGEL